MVDDILKTAMYLNFYIKCFKFFLIPWLYDIIWFSYHQSSCIQKQTGNISVLRLAGFFTHRIYFCNWALLKGVFAKNDLEYWLPAKNNRVWSLLILLLSVVSIRRKLLKTAYTEDRSFHINWESCNIQLVW